FAGAVGLHRDAPRAPRLALEQLLRDDLTGHEPVQGLARATARSNESVLTVENEDDLRALLEQPPPPFRLELGVLHNPASVCRRSCSSKTTTSSRRPWRTICRSRATTLWSCPTATPASSASASRRRMCASST